jgi:hypothetical protein
MEAACTAQAAAEASSTDNQLAHKAATAKRAASIAQERLRLRHGRAGNVQPSPTEPEAVLQLRKDGVPRPSYKPMVMVHEAV